MRFRRLIPDRAPSSSSAERGGQRVGARQLLFPLSVHAAQTSRDEPSEAERDDSWKRIGRNGGKPELFLDSGGICLSSQPEPTLPALPPPLPSSRFKGGAAASVPGVGDVFLAAAHGSEA